MDLPKIQTVIRPRSRDALPSWAADAAWLAGGTWLLSEPQPGLRTLVDLASLEWPALEAFETPADWRAAPLFGGCSRALLGSFKIAAVATVGGNVCLSLPAAPMLALTVALDGVAGVRHVGVLPGSYPAPDTAGVVTGAARYTLDVEMPDLLHMRLLRSPHAHARIRAIDRAATLAVPGVAAVFTHEDAPARLYSSARHEDFRADPDDTRLLDDVVRFVGQRVAAVVAETETAAEAGCRALVVDYEVLPAVFDPSAAMRPGAPVLHDKPTSRIADPARNLVASLQARRGDVDAGFACCAPGSAAGSAASRRCWSRTSPPWPRSASAVRSSWSSPAPSSSPRPPPATPCASRSGPALTGTAC